MCLLEKGEFVSVFLSVTTFMVKMFVCLLVGILIVFSVFDFMSKVWYKT